MIPKATEEAARRAGNQGAHQAHEPEVIDRERITDNQGKEIVVKKPNVERLGGPTYVRAAGQEGRAQASRKKKGPKGVKPLQRLSP